MKKLFLFFLFAFSLLPLHAQELKVVSQNAPEEAQFSVPFDVQFVLQHTPGYTVRLAEETLPEGFPATKITATANTSDTLTYDLTVMPLTLEISSFTAVTFNLIDRNEQILAAAQSREMLIDVKPIQVFKDKNFREIRGPWIPFNWLLWLMILLLFAALIAGSYYAAGKLFRPKVSAPFDEDKRPSNVIALSKIDALVNSGLWEQHQYKLFYITLSDIFREYLWRRFGMDVSSSTSTELLRDVKKIPELSPLLSYLKAYVQSSDLVKFAKMIPEEKQMQQDVKIIRHTVAATAPQPERKEEDND